MLRQPRKHTYTTFKLIQIGAEENLRWWQLQNTTPTPGWYFLEPMLFLGHLGDNIQCEGLIQIIASQLYIHAGLAF